MKNIADEISKLVIDNLKRTVPIAAQKQAKMSTLLDSSTKPMGFTKITKKGFTP